MCSFECYIIYTWNGFKWILILWRYEGNANNVYLKSDNLTDLHWSDLFSKLQICTCIFTYTYVYIYIKTSDFLGWKCLPIRFSYGLQCLPRNKSSWIISLFIIFLSIKVAFNFSNSMHLENQSLIKINLICSSVTPFGPDYTGHSPIFTAPWSFTQTHI